MLDRRPALARRLLWLTVLLCISGCGRSDRPQTVPVRGVITFGGGTWPKPGRIIFTCVDPEAGYPLHPGTAEFNEYGEFVATTFERGDGLVPGTFRLSVECWEVPPNFDGIPAQSIVPERYHNPATNGLAELVVRSSDDKRVLALDIPKP